MFFLLRNINAMFLKVHSIIYMYLFLSTIYKRISGLVFNILLTKILSHKFLNSPNYPYLLVK